MRVRAFLVLLAMLAFSPLFAQEAKPSNKELAESLHHSLVKKNFASLQKLHDEDLALLKKDPGDFALYDYYEALCETRNIDLLKKWAHKDDQSYVPWVALGRALINKAWEFRGTAVASKVKASAWTPFKECLDESKAYLEKAEAQGVDDPYAYNGLMIIGRAQFRAKYVMKKYFEESLKACPDNWDAKVKMAFYLSPMWCGSVEEMAEFVKQYGLKAPKGSYDRLLVVSFHDEKGKILKDVGKYMRDPKIFAEVHREFETYLAVHPERMAVRSWYAFWCLYSAHSILANKEFNILGENWDANSNFWLTKETYDKAKKQAADYAAKYPPPTVTPTPK